MGVGALAQKDDRQELERRLEQSRRLAGEALDPVTQQRLKLLVQDLELQLRPSD
jgi:TATA-binding protein-associated factor Taf7